MTHRQWRQRRRCTRRAGLWCQLCSVPVASERESASAVVWSCDGELGLLTDISPALQARLARAPTSKQVASRTRMHPSQLLTQRLSRGGSDNLVRHFIESEWW